MVSVVVVGGPAALEAGTITTPVVLSVDDPEAVLLVSGTTSVVVVVDETASEVGWVDTIEDEL